MGTLPPSPWFRGVRLNFAENILFSASAASPSLGSTAGKEDDKVALTEVREGCAEITHVTWAELRARVARLARAMRARGVKRGDRVAVVAGNGVDTCVTFLATTAVGGLFSSSSTDMGSRGILDRLRQVKPRWVFADDWAVYNGKRVDLRGKIREVVSGLEDVREFEGVVVLPRFGGRVDDLKGVEKAESLEDFVRSGGKGEAELQFERVEFADPFLIVYSSGTTGQPKCIVHSTGGVLIAGMKEGRIHRDLGPDTVQLQYTTVSLTTPILDCFLHVPQTGWIMYLFAVQSLLFGARVILYDGSPFLPEPKAFIRLVGEQRCVPLFRFRNIPGDQPADHSLAQGHEPWHIPPLPSDSPAGRHLPACRHRSLRSTLRQLDRHGPDGHAIRVVLRRRLSRARLARQHLRRYRLGRLLRDGESAGASTRGRVPGV